MRVCAEVLRLQLLFVEGSIAADSPIIDRITTSQVAVLFPPKSKPNVEANWPMVKAELTRIGLGNSREVIIYALATIRVETGTFTPEPERPSKQSKTLDRASYAGIQDSDTPG
jgi:hypothetical protein